MLRVQDIANGKWRGILVGLGVDESILTGKHTACPICGGTDRFRFDDKDGRGTYYCNGCGAGDGIALVQKVRGITFRDAVAEVERVVGFVRAEEQKAGKTDEQKLAALKRVWSESSPLRDGDMASVYLAGRGLLAPKTLRLHPGLPYRDGLDYIGKYPAMIARVQAKDGRGVSIHRTYLQDGHKAPVTEPKKLMEGLPTKGAAIRLYHHEGILGVAEGIETAIAATMLRNIPTWSCLNANGIASFDWPDDAQKLVVFGDNDANYAGQKAAYTLANRAAMAGIECEVLIPGIVGRDWADMLSENTP